MKRKLTTSFLMLIVALLSFAFTYFIVPSNNDKVERTKVEEELAGRININSSEIQHNRELIRVGDKALFDALEAHVKNQKGQFDRVYKNQDELAHDIKTILSNVKE